jgi:CRISPR-associated Cas5-like protein
VLFVYSGDGGVQRVFAAETGRALGESAILGAVASSCLPAEGWLSSFARREPSADRKSYPFPTDNTAAGGIEPCSCPGWSLPRRYVWSGNVRGALSGSPVENR